MFLTGKQFRMWNLLEEFSEYQCLLGNYGTVNSMIYKGYYDILGLPIHSSKIAFNLFYFLQCLGNKYIVVKLQNLCGCIFSNS